VAITSVPPSLDDQHDARRRKYLIMMGLRVVCVVAAAAVFRSSLWLALVFMVGGVVLPWCAVLIANDRPARNRTAFVGYRPPFAANQLPRQGSVGPQDSDEDNAPEGPAARRGSDPSTSPTTAALRPPLTIEWLDSGQDS
jgi:hypothetical protein